ncbi:hypothetical protein TNCV_620951 [Trichonephila clavipes]|nr:hypothetical protein TNCV_620951 [Trichonephila clavipes]
MHIPPTSAGIQRETENFHGDKVIPSEKARATPEKGGNRPIRRGKKVSCGQIEKANKDFNDDHRITDFVHSIPGFQEGGEEDVETWMACDAEDCGFLMLNDDEIVTSVQEESDPVDDETDEDEDNNNNNNETS